MSERASLPSITPDSDAGLLRRYQAAPGGETFRPLALRHLPLIWSTARRLVNGDHALAEDVAQVVLADFARKAPGLPPDTVAAGWLHRHTCFTARKMVRTEVRRRDRERRAWALHGPDDAGAAGASLSMSSESHPLWQEAAPLLDAVLNQLARRDREAVLLRFYQRQDHRSIGAAMGCTEEAARKRIARALEKLRTVFRRRGVPLTAVLLAQLLTDHATAAVPGPLAATLPGTAWRQATAAGAVRTASLNRMRGLFMPAAAAVLTVACGFWAAYAEGWFSPTPSGYDGSRATAMEKATVGPIPLLRCTLIQVPAKHLSARLLTWQSGGDDSELLTEAHRLAPSGGGLVEFELSVPPGRAAGYEDAYSHGYATQWEWDGKSAAPEPVKTENWTVGTHFAATLTAGKPMPDSTGGAFELGWALDYHFADPTTVGWPVSAGTSGTATGQEFPLEEFYGARASGRAGGLRENTPRLLLIQHLPASVLPGSAPEPLTLLLFATLNPS